MQTEEIQKIPDWPYLVRDFRQYLGLSAIKFAELYKVTRQTVYNWEGGKVPPPAELTHDVMVWVLEEEKKGRGFDA